MNKQRWGANQSTNYPLVRYSIDISILRLDWHKRSTVINHVVFKIFTSRHASIAQLQLLINFSIIKALTALSSGTWFAIPWRRTAAKLLILDLFSWYIGSLWRWAWSLKQLDNTSKSLLWERRKIQKSSQKFGL